MNDSAVLLTRIGISLSQSIEDDIESQFFGLRRHRIFGSLGALVSPFLIKAVKASFKTSALPFISILIFSQYCENLTFWQLWLFSNFQKSQSHDFDFFQNPKKVKVMTLTFLKIPRKSKSWLWLFSKSQKSQSHDFDLTFIMTFLIFFIFYGAQSS